MFRLIVGTVWGLDGVGSYELRQQKASFTLTVKAILAALDVALKSEVSDEDAMFSNTLPRKVL